MGRILGRDGRFDHFLDFLIGLCDELYIRTSLQPGTKEDLTSIVFFFASASLDRVHLSPDRRKINSVA